MRYTGQHLVNAARSQRTELSHELGRAQHYLMIHHERREQVARAFATATSELGRAVLPGMTRESLADAAALTGYQRPVAEDAIGAMERERAALRERLAAIEADPRYRDRELLRHPRTGSLSRALAEVNEMRRPFHDVLIRAAHPRLERLLAGEYGTPRYTTGFWRLSYYEDWAAGDEILERFPDKEFFAQVRDEVLRAQEAVGPLDAEAARVGAEIAAGEALEAEHKARTQSLATLAQRWLEQTRSQIVAFLLECPPAALAKRLAANPEVLLLFKRATGMQHKARYLDRIVDQYVRPFSADLQRSLAKAERDIVKWSRPKNAHRQIPAHEFERRFRDRRAAYNKRWQRYERTYGAVYAYDGYRSVDLATNVLWWDVMTDGRLDGSFIPEVADYHRDNPSYQYQRSRDAEAEYDAASSFDDRSDRSAGLVDVS
ncbi:MAG: hypothetical protein KIT84_33875 [Labilithrix sp.]|nr:hypothetical protein [Labilithrix sp.]MCW5816036.1 hypothetical protein [Labilithrix sp.]